MTEPCVIRQADWRTENGGQKERPQKNDCYAERLARVDDTIYATFENVPGDWESGSTLTLLDDVTLDDTLTVGSGTYILDLNGHTLDRGLGGATSGSDGSGSVIKVDGGSLTVTDSVGTGKITGGYYSAGAGVRVASGSFTLAGGSITGNRADGYSGGGVYVDNSARFAMTGGSITGNDTTAYGGGVYVANGASFSLHGKCTITGNTDSYNDATTPSNVYFQSIEIPIVIDGDLDAATSVGVTSDSGMTVTSGLSGHGSKDNFFADDAQNCEFRTTGGGEARLVKLFSIRWKDGITGVASKKITSDAAGEHTISRAEENETVYVHFTLGAGYSPWKDDNESDSPVWYLAPDIDNGHYEKASGSNGVYSFSMPSDDTTVDIRTTGESGVVLTLDAGATVKLVDNTKPMNDVKGDEWYADNIAWATSHEVMNGVGGGNFAPNDPTTQGMMEQILFNIDGNERVTPAEGEAWWNAADGWAAQGGVTDGVASHDPAAPATREVDILMMFNYAKAQGYDTSARASLDAFSDASSVSAEAREAMAWAVAVGIINGSTDENGNVILDAQGVATRAQVAAIMERFCEKVAK